MWTIHLKVCMITLKREECFKGGDKLLIHWSISSLNLESSDKHCNIYNKT